MYHLLSGVMTAALTVGCLLIAYVLVWARGRLPVVRRLLAEHRALRADADRERGK